MWFHMLLHPQAPFSHSNWPNVTTGERIIFLCSLAEIMSAQLSLGHKTCFVTKDPDLYVEKEQQLLSLSLGTISMFEEKKREPRKSKFPEK